MPSGRRGGQQRAPAGRKRSCSWAATASITAFIHGPGSAGVRAEMRLPSTTQASSTLAVLQHARPSPRERFDPDTTGGPSMGMFTTALVLAQETTDVSLNLTLPGVLALIAGILILIMPRLLNYVVAAYLIVVGLVQIFDITL
jgi:hypothetical protein